MATLHEQMQVTQDLSNTTHETTKLTKETVQITEALRDDIANFDDFFRPIRSYFYWEKHCYDIPICWALRSIFNALDGIDQVAENIVNLSANLDKLDQIQPKLVALIPPQIESQQRNLDTIMSNYATTWVSTNRRKRSPTTPPPRAMPSTKRRTTTRSTFRRRRSRARISRGVSNSSSRRTGTPSG